MDHDKALQQVKASIEALEFGIVEPERTVIHIMGVVHRYAQELNAALLESDAKFKSQLFYLHCHPEDVEQVVNELLFGKKTERDRYGHVV
jgi:hypothetical protein